MPRKRIPNFNYSLVTINGHQYYKTYAQNADGKLVIIYGKTIEELCEKYDAAEHRTVNVRIKQNNNKTISSLPRFQGTAIYQMATPSMDMM